MSENMDKSNLQIVSGTLLALIDTAYMLRYGNQKEKKDACLRLDLIRQDIRVIDGPLKLEIIASLKEYSVPFDPSNLKKYYYAVRNREYSSQALHRLRDSLKMFHEEIVRPNKHQGLGASMRSV